MITKNDSGILPLDVINLQNLSISDSTTRGRTAVPRIEVPTAKVSLPKESPALDAPQSLIARYYNLVRYTRLPRGGHFAFWEQPAPMVADVREFFRTLRS